MLYSCDDTGNNSVTCVSQSYEEKTGCLVAYTFFPILCAYFIVFAKSSSFTSALLLKESEPVPQYTASAPY